ncbi:MAG TPA: sulfotransferase domain-containing protein [Blastocatellia bacterium]|nr:sulfotransferase domain-containing protein [Blastocatellia bacterium]
MQNEPIIVVSGLPRSGTSMMMSMLAAAGVPALTDSIRTADEDNPKGYFELEKVKELAKDNGWLAEAGGKAVKIISALLKHLPGGYRYKVIFMRREMQEILASQRQMLIRRGEPADTVSDERMAEMFRKHLAEVESWLAKQPNIEVSYTNYNRMLDAPAEHIETINAFLGGKLDTAAMSAVVDKTLHRQRA